MSRSKSEVLRREEEKERRRFLQGLIVDAAVTWTNAMRNDIDAGELEWDELETLERKLYQRVEDYQRAGFGAGWLKLRRREREP